MRVGNYTLLWGLINAIILGLAIYFSPNKNIAIMIGVVFGIFIIPIYNLVTIALEDIFGINIILDSFP